MLFHFTLVDKVFSLDNFNVLLGYACLPGSSGQRYKWSDWHFMERSRCPKRYLFLLVNLLPNFRCNCGSRRKLGLVHFRRDFWDCYKVWRCRKLARLRAVSYFSLQSYCTRNLSTRAANPRAGRNEGVSPRRKKKRLLTLLFCLGTTKLSR